MSWRSHPSLVALLALILAGCQASPSSKAEAMASVPIDAPLHRVVDSLRPIDEEIARFTAAVPAATRLRGGSPAREALVRRWVHAVETADSLAIGTLLLTAGEFIGLYYPNTPYTHPPYRQAPQIVWARILHESLTGATRVVRRLGGRPLGYRETRCDPEPTLLGPIRVWTGCHVVLERDGNRREARLFGPILEVDGQFKFLTYASEY